MRERTSLIVKKKITIMGDLEELNSYKIKRLFSAWSE